MPFIFEGVSSETPFVGEELFLEDPHFIHLHQIFELHQGAVVFEGQPDSVHCVCVWPVLHEFYQYEGGHDESPRC